MNKIMSSIDIAQCLVLDKRIQNFANIHDSILSTFGIDILPFIAGDGITLPLEQYHHIDITNKLPIYNGSILYDSWYAKPSAYNAHLCHKSMMEIAMYFGSNTILMLEDDIFIENDAIEILNSTEDFFVENPFDILYLGAYHQESRTKQVHEHVLKVDGSAGFHAVILTRPVVKELLKYDPIGPFDWICGEELHKKYNAYAIYPSIISQQDGFSFVEDRELKKPSRFFR